MNSDVTANEDKMNHSVQGDPENVIFDNVECSKVDVDEVWHFLGRFGRYQVSQFIMAGLFFANMAQPLLSGVFTGKEIEYKCAIDNKTLMGLPPNHTVVASTCNIRVIDNTTMDVVSMEPCTKFEYEGKHASYMSEWDLVCDRESLGQLPQVLVMAGMGVGAITLPQLGDVFGRRKTAIPVCLGVFLATLVLAFINNFELFLFIKFISGAFQPASVVSLYILQVEILPTELRSFVSLETTCVWVTSMCIVGGVAYVFRNFDWRTVQMASALTMVPALLNVFFLDESLRWLLGNSRRKDANKILKKACRMNRKDYNKMVDTLTKPKDDEIDLLPPKDVAKDEVDGSPDQPKNIFSAIARNRNVRKISFVMCFTWMITSLTYYGLTLLSTSLAGDPYVNYLLSSIVELPSGFFIFYTMKKYGRKKTVIFSNFMAASTLILAVATTMFAPPQQEFATIQTILTLFGKFFISCTFNAIWIYTPELYPTNLRNMGIGLNSTAARIGSAFSPLFIMMSRKAVWAPGVIFTVGCYISVFLLTMIPETLWRELPKTVEDIDDWIKDDTPHVDEDKDDNGCGCLKPSSSSSSSSKRTLNKQKLNNKYEKSLVV